MPSECFCRKDFEVWQRKKDAEMFPYPHEIDDVRVWNLTFYFEDGNSIIYEGEEAVWGTSRSVKKLAEFQKKIFNGTGRKVLFWETERDDSA